MEAVENTREKQEFVNAINQTSESHTMQEMKQLIEKQNETVNAIPEAVGTLLRREEKPFATQNQGAAVKPQNMINVKYFKKIRNSRNDTHFVCSNYMLQKCHI